MEYRGYDSDGLATLSEDRILVRKGVGKVAEVESREALTSMEGFTGVGHSVEDCLYQAKWGMNEHVRLLEEQGMPVPLPNPRPRVIIENAPALRQAG